MAKRIQMRKNRFLALQKMAEQKKNEAAAAAAAAAAGMGGEGPPPGAPASPANMHRMPKQTVRELQPGGLRFKSVIVFS